MVMADSIARLLNAGSTNAAKINCLLADYLLNDAGTPDPLSTNQDDSESTDHNINLVAMAF